MEEKCYRINKSLKNVLNTTQLPLSRLGRKCLDKIPLDTPKEKILLEVGLVLSY
jgi:hypothetical protein